MTDPTARRAISDALRPALESEGWRSRASGWWSRDLGSGWSGVIALGVAVAHMPAGEGMATLYIGARNDAIEDQVAAIIGYRASYQQRTLNTSIGYLMPEARWREWVVTTHTADGVARELAAAVQAYGLPYLRSAVVDQEAILAETGRAFDQAPGYARHVLMTQRLLGTDAGRRTLASLRERLAGRNDPAAQQAHEVLAAVERAAPE